MEEEASVKGYTEILKNFGVPVALLTVIVIGSWKAVVWLGVNVADPLVKNQIEFTQSIKKTNETQADTSSKQADLIEKISNTMNAIQETEKHQEQILEQLSKQLSRQEEQPQN